MDSYFCIISTSRETVADLCVLRAATDRSALKLAGEIAERWEDVQTVAVYQGERSVGSLNYAGQDSALLQAA